MLEGKTAVVTGAGQGIGRAIALRLAANGANIVVSDVVEETARQVVGEVEALGREAIPVVCDVRELDQCQALMKQSIERFGRIDVLVNNAGVTRDGLLMRMSEDDWDFVLAVNLKGTFNCCKSVVRTMMKQRAGRIVNIASVVGLIGNAGQVNYSASKAGVIGLTKTLAKEFAPRGVTVNAVAPGFITTAMTDKLSDEARDALKQHIPLQELGQPDHVADAVLFLASDLSSYVTGETIRVDGGMAM